MNKSYAALTIYIFLALILLISLNLPNVWAEAKIVTINANNLNVRQGPGLHYQVVTQVDKGETYTVLEQRDGWVKIKLRENQSGWVSSSFTSDTKKMSEAAISAVDYLRVRTNPGTHYKTIGYLRRGQEVEVIEKAKEWVKIKSGGLTGWVYGSYLTERLIEEDKTSTSEPATVIANKLNVRATPALTAQVIGKLEYGDKIHVLDQQNGWYKVKHNSKLVGWVHGTYISFEQLEERQQANSYVKILHNQTNVRISPSLNSYILTKANIGETYRIVSKQGDWYEIELPGQRRGYIASWIVQTTHGTGSDKTIKKKTIILDPGHGGKDSGTIGSGGTVEKALTLHTALLLQKKFEKAGANVILTRTSDSFVPLNTRASTTAQHSADIFISIHYDSSHDSRANGLTVYYYDEWRDSALAQSLNFQFSTLRTINNRGVRFGNFLVLRANTRPSVLLELGYLSNRKEEQLVSSNLFQEQITDLIYKSVVDYFQTR